jgi:hypothetical protein
MLLINCCGSFVSLENLATSGEFYVIGVVMSLFFGLLVGLPILCWANEVKSTFGKIIGTVLLCIIPITMVVLIICSIHLNYKIKTKPVINHTCNVDISKLKCYQDNYIICEDCMKSFTIKK